MTKVIKKTYINPEIDITPIEGGDVLDSIHIGSVNVSGDEQLSKESSYFIFEEEEEEYTDYGE